MSSFSILGIGGIYEDVMLTVPHFPHEDSKLRATSRKTRLGGNIPNTLGVLSQILIKEKEDNWRLFFMGALGDDESSVYVLFFSFFFSRNAANILHPVFADKNRKNKIFEVRVGKRTHQTMHLE